ncbi:hypothetical protein PUNSTDRAFT_106257 [Punctularia strigosozonata HHB-11173 SS5]|uniref:uncharacterized protein n=1 Tax=Punctularia strigosozonata (strain HHB-11173) TaxID=741275 RepID=UPI0004417FDB|nr:uncharacterized protein PUNSTDRAFT_106257 [Punctularia strigosozonata HHB-11173 SS5]EIN06073.1 hypothetical protein PUNSTDRAFT_106257 [Punctularia strigosozonata HHB-11173 SS5]
MMTSGERSMAKLKVALYDIKPVINLDADRMARLQLLDFTRRPASAPNTENNSQIPSVFRLSSPSAYLSRMDISTGDAGNLKGFLTGFTAMNAAHESLLQASALVERAPRQRGKLPKPVTDYLKEWFHRHSDHPYPTEEEKNVLCAATGLSMSQVNNWMINVSPTTRNSMMQTIKPSPV